MIKTFVADKAQGTTLPYRVLKALAALTRQDCIRWALLYPEADHIFATPTTPTDIPALRISITQEGPKSYRMNIKNLPLTLVYEGDGAEALERELLTAIHEQAADRCEHALISLLTRSGEEKTTEDAQKKEPQE